MNIKHKISIFVVLLFVMCLARKVLAVNGIFYPLKEIRSGLFLGLAGGYNEREDSNDEFAEAMFAPGYLHTAAIGYRFENLDNQILKNIRIELEYARQYNEIDRLHLHPPTDPPIDTIENAQGRIDIESIQGGIYYDFPLKQFLSLEDASWLSLSRVTPYIGIGFGFGRSILKDLGSETLITYVEGYPLNTTTDWVFVYTPRIGISYEINRTIDLFVAGRSHKSENVTVNAAGDYTKPPVETWAAELGFRYNF